MYCSRNYAGLEDMVSYSPDYASENQTNYMIEATLPENRVRPYYNSFDNRNDYSITDSYLTYTKNSRNITYVFEPEIFLRQNRPRARFINTSEDVKDLVEKTFRIVMGKELENVIIKVCSEEGMKRLHDGWNTGILGFSINNGIILNQIFVKNDFLDRLLITIGHEIGHVLTAPLKNRHDEEAKAFAFEFAWVKAIRENDIGNLGMCLRKVIPAKNDLHDIAFDFVLDKVKEEKDALELFDELSKGLVSLDDF